MRLLHATLATTLVGSAHAHAAATRAVRPYSTRRPDRHSAAAAAANPSSRQPHAAPALVQRLARLASSSDIDAAQREMDLLEPASLALQLPHDWERRSISGRPPVSYVHVFGDDATFSMGIFLLPAGAIIPLHDHPGMTVLSKVLVGSLRATSFDMPEGAPGVNSSAPHFYGMASWEPRSFVCGEPTERLISEGSPTARLEPLRGNLHQFEALNDTAVFDILLPPYDDDRGRSCHYYQMQPLTSSVASSTQYKLVEIPQPADLHIISAPYHGPTPTSP
mgnify:CR=1 FL=1